MRVLVVPKPSIATKNDHVQVVENTLFMPKYDTHLMVACVLLTNHVESSKEIYIALKPMHRRTNGCAHSTQNIDCHEERSCRSSREYVIYARVRYFSNGCVRITNQPC